MHRRDFNLGVLKMSAAAVLGPRLMAKPFAVTAAKRAADPAPDIAALYKNAIVIDSLAAPFSDTDTPPTAELIAVVRASGVLEFRFPSCTFVSFVVNDSVNQATSELGAA